MCQINAAFGHHSDQITIAELVAEVPANVQDHDLLVEVATFEQLFDRYELRHFSIIAKPIRVCTRADDIVIRFRLRARCARLGPRHCCCRDSGKCRRPI